MNRQRRRAAVLVLLTSLLAVTAGCVEQDRDAAGLSVGSRSGATSVDGGDGSRAPEAIERYGCASCHSIPGIAGADARVGPRLDDFANQVYIAGQLPNRPEELVRWIQDPQSIEPGTAMPDMGVTEQDARDIAAYLYGDR